MDDDKRLKTREPFDDFMTRRAQQIRREIGWKESEIQKIDKILETQIDQYAIKAMRLTQDYIRAEQNGLRRALYIIVGVRE